MALQAVPDFQKPLPLPAWLNLWTVASEAPMVACETFARVGQTAPPLGHCSSLEKLTDFVVATDASSDALYNQQARVNQPATRRRRRSKNHADIYSNHSRHQVAFNSN